MNIFSKWKMKDIGEINKFISENYTEITRSELKVSDEESELHVPNDQTDYITELVTYVIYWLSTEP